MSTYLWSDLLNNDNISFNPEEDILIFDSGIDSYMQLPSWDLQAGFSTFTDLSGKTVTFTGLGAHNISTNNVQFAGSDARFFIGDLSASTADDDLANAISGSTGNDVIFGFGGNDTLNGGDGDDLIYALGGGNDVVNGGAGVDWYMATTGATSGMTVNLNVGRAYGFANGGTDSLISIEGVRGTMHNDNLIGNNTDNQFRGRAGDDKIFGRGGNDWVIYAESNAIGGIDVDLDAGLAYDDGFGGLDMLVSIENVRGGFFDDYIVGNNDYNILRGDTGNDTLIGGYGSDTLRGGEGDDLLQGGFESGSEYDYGYGEPENIDIADYSDATAGIVIDLNTTGPQNTMGAGTDTLLDMEGVAGSQFADTLNGNAFGNALYGAAGNDTLLGGDGDDSLQGGAGDDTLDGGAGNDTAYYTRETAGITINLGLTGQQDTVNSGLETLTSIENLIGSGFNDKLTGNTLANRIEGGGGNDNISGGGGSDWMVGGDGNDVINGGLGIDTVSYADAQSGVNVNLSITTGQNTGGGGTDRLINIEILEGSDFNDVLTAQASGSRLYGGMGNNLLIGGAGNDVLAGTDANGYYNYAATNTVSYAGATGGVHVDLSNNNTSQDIGGGQGWDTLININRLIGSNFDDLLTSGWSGAQYLEGRAGNDRITAYQGHRHDTLDGGAGADTLALDEYFNNQNGVTLNLGSTEAQFYDSGNQSGSLTLSGFENVVGSAGNDNITGTSGNNTMEGNRGNDTLDGSAGVDTLSYASSNIYYEYYFDGMTAISGFRGVTISLGINSAQDTGTGHGIDTISGFENLIGTTADDALTGNASSNIIEGGDGNDDIDGGAGFDTASYTSASSGVTVSLSISGQQWTIGAGGDTLNRIEHLMGSSHGDTLTGNNIGNRLQGGLGADYLSGGLGADTFLYSSVQDSAAGSADVITDFTTGENDKIHLLVIDANSTVAGNQAFSFIGSDVFTAAGQVRFEAGTVYADVDGDAVADLQIELTGVATLEASNFVL